MVAARLLDDQLRTANGVGLRLPRFSNRASLGETARFDLQLGSQALKTDLFWPIGLILVAIASSVWAQGVDLQLCTASASGNYYASGQEIARHAERSGVTVSLVETDGSMDNLERLALGECDAGIVQIDAYLVYQGAHSGDRLDIRRPLHLYDEYVHLVCRRDRGVESVENLSGQPEGPTLLVGPPRSGGAVSWHSFTLLDSGYADAKIQNVGGVAALDSLKAGDAGCLLFISGLGSDYGATVDEAGDTLQLVTVNDEDLEKAEFAGEPIYRFADIPAGSYPGLQGPSGDPVETLTVRAIFIISNTWADMSPVAFEALTAAVESATPAIRKRVSVE